MKKTIEEVKKKAEATLMKISGVEGVGIIEENGEKVIAVFCSQKPESLKGKIPDRKEGFKIKIIYSGEFTALKL